MLIRSINGENEICKINKKTRQLVNSHQLQTSSQEGSRLKNIRGNPFKLDYPRLDGVTIVNWFVVHFQVGLIYTSLLLTGIFNEKILDPNICYVKATYYTAIYTVVNDRVHQL